MRIPSHPTASTSGTPARPALARVAARLALAALLGLVLVSGGGCAVAYFIGGAAQNFEYQKKIQVLPKYDLEGNTVAVVVDADMLTLYQFPQLVAKISSGVAGRMQRDVPNVRITPPADVIAWQWQTPQWNAMSYGEMADSLDVDRVVYIDLYEFRLNPPGNQWLWDGVCAANVSVIERDGFDPDTFADTFNVSSSFPDEEGVDREAASAQAIEMGLLADFIKRTAWLFHEHTEPKYPDRYRPELDA